MAALAAEIRAMDPKPDMVLVDTVNRNFGPGDENSTADMTLAVAGLDMLRTSSGSCVVSLHHSGHGDKGRGRGSSVLLGALDFEYVVTKCDKVVQITGTKVKDFDLPPPLAWTLEKQPLPWADETGAPMDSAVLVAGDLESMPMQSITAKLGSNQAKALEALKTLYRQARERLEAADLPQVHAQVTQAEWYAVLEDAGFSRSRRTDTKSGLIDRGMIRMDGDIVRLTRGF
jgi:hypothetical protein